MTNTATGSPATSLSEALKQALRTKLLARGVPSDTVDQWLAECGTLGELTNLLIAWCRRPSGEN